MPGDSLCFLKTTWTQNCIWTNHINGYVPCLVKSCKVFNSDCRCIGKYGSCIWHYSSCPAVLYHFNCKKTLSKRFVSLSGSKTSTWRINVWMHWRINTLLIELWAFRLRTTADVGMHVSRALSLDGTGYNTDYYQAPSFDTALYLLLSCNIQCMYNMRERGGESGYGACG